MPSKCQQAGAHSLLGWLHFLAEALRDTAICPVSFSGHRSWSENREAESQGSQTRSRRPEQEPRGKRMGTGLASQASIPSSSLLPSHACDANPLNVDFMQAECKGKQKLSPHLHQVLLCFWSLASSHRYFGRTFVLDSCVLRARSSGVLHAMSWEHPAAGVRSVMESVSYCGNWI